MNIVFFLPLLTIVCCAKKSIESTFSRQTICDLEARLVNSCSKLDSTVRSSLECLTRCSNKNVCVGASVTQDMKCFVHMTCPAVTTCGAESTSHEYFSKNCENRGIWKPATSTCQCVDGWVGERCNKLPRNCNELITHGYSTGPYTVTLDLSDKNLTNIEVVCYIKTTPPTYSLIYLMTNGGKVGNNKDWEDFCNGYDSGASHMWLGLNKWHILSEAGYNTLTFKGYFYVPSVLEMKWHYYGFKLLGEADNYAFSFDYAVNETTGGDKIQDQVGDCFGDLQNVSFSTSDRDNDLEASENCAFVMGAGWWYTSCEGPCHVMGWGQGYAGFVDDVRLINLVGVDMGTMRQKLVMLEMHLKTPPGID